MSLFGPWPLFINTTARFAYPQETARFRQAMLQLRSAVYEDMDRVLEPAATALVTKVKNGRFCDVSRVMVVHWIGHRGFRAC